MCVCRGMKIYPVSRVRNWYENWMRACLIHVSTYVCSTLRDRHKTISRTCWHESDKLACNFHSCLEFYSISFRTILHPNKCLWRHRQIREIEKWLGFLIHFYYIICYGSFHSIYLSKRANTQLAAIIEEAHKTLSWL